MSGWNLKNAIHTLSIASRSWSMARLQTRDGRSHLRLKLGMIVSHQHNEPIEILLGASDPPLQLKPHDLLIFIAFFRACSIVAEICSAMEALTASSAMPTELVTRSAMVV